MTSLAGFEALRTLGGAVVIVVNDSLASPAGLSALTAVVGGVTIESNRALASLTGLDNLTSVGGDLIIKDSALADLSASTASRSCKAACWSRKETRR